MIQSVGRHLVGGKVYELVAKCNEVKGCNGCRLKEVGEGRLDEERTSVYSVYFWTRLAFRFPPQADDPTPRPHFFRAGTKTKLKLTYNGSEIN